MLKQLRLQLTLLYPLVGLALVVLMGGGSYLLVRYYFLVEYYPDLELEARMVEELNQLQIPLPAELQEAAPAWESLKAKDALQDSALSILYLNASGQPIAARGEIEMAVLPRGLEGAQTRGRDLRTAQMPGGFQARILTYRLPPGAGPAAYVQIGKKLTTQDLLINQLYIVLIALGVAVAVLVASFSWWLAGRSLLPAQRAWEHQQQFIANASHELRTPITLIRANAEVALRPSTRENRRLELLEDIVQECDHVSQLIEDMLLLSRLDVGKITLNKEPLSVEALLSEVQQQFASLAEEHQVALVKESGAELIRGDRTRLRQVLMILVDNALKFTSAGGRIRLAASQAGSQIVLTIQDTGAGIPPQHLPHVFERFYQADSQPAGAKPSSGLGLSIAQALVQAQGGSIQIHSQVGEGTCVTLLFPAAQNHLSQQ